MAGAFHRHEPAAGRALPRAALAMGDDFVLIAVDDQDRTADAGDRALRRRRSGGNARENGVGQNLGVVSSAQPTASSICLVSADRKAPRRRRSPRSRDSARASSADYISPSPRPRWPRSSKFVPGATRLEGPKARRARSAPRHQLDPGITPPSSRARCPPRDSPTMMAGASRWHPARRWRLRHIRAA